MISALSYYRLGCLMRQFLAHVLVNHAFGLHQLCDMAEPPRIAMINVSPGQAVQLPDVGGETVPTEVRESLRRNISAIEDEAKKLELRGSFDAIQTVYHSLSEDYYPKRGLAHDAWHLHDSLVADLRYTTCFGLWGESEKLYRADHLFGQEVADRFPTIATDIEEAGKCLAFDRGTACVFHLMRALEVGLQALAADLGIAKIERNWQMLLQEVDAKVRGLPFRTDVEKARLAARSAAAAHLRNVKDAWRNDVMHPRDVYTVEQATDIFRHTHALMITLSGFLSWPQATP